jgi:DUF4097 and DUF4098 domain-containing protein YvlB
MGGVSGVIDSIPSIIRHSARLGSRGGKKTLSVKKKPAVRFSLVGGDLTLSPSDDDTIRGNLSSGVVTTRDARGELWIKCLGGDADIQIPQIDTLSVSIVGGDVRGEADANTLTIKTLEGDISILLRSLNNAVLKSKSGDVHLTLPQTSDAQVDAYTMSGEIDFKPKLEVEEQTDNHIKGKMGQGKGNLSIVNLSGNITVDAENQ